jgi:hypothetical protein
MLGFLDPPDPDPTPEEIEMSDLAADIDRLPGPATPPTTHAPEEIVVDLDDDPFAPPADEGADAAEAAGSPTAAGAGSGGSPPVWPLAHSDTGTEASEGAEGSVPDDEMQEFMRSSPVLGASARPVRRPTRPRPTHQTPAAATLTALASEVAHLSVPEGQRAAARAQLLELARSFDEQTLTWEALRSAITFAMDYPALARRVIPMLIPYLDLAA